MNPPESPYAQKEGDLQTHTLTPTIKAYLNTDFLKSSNARVLRILCEFQEPAQRLNDAHVKGTILFFGSARSMSKPQFMKTMLDLEGKVKNASDKQELSTLEAKMESFKKCEWMCEYADKVELLSQKLTHWSMTCVELQMVYASRVDYLTGELRTFGEASAQPLVVSTGGGPGIMEAANKGARSCQGAKTIGMGISLPFEKGLNPYVNVELAFEFHYFFTRKFWMMYCAQALIIGPGGFGTMDELFELMTLKQTGKMPDIPIVLLGKKYWTTIINWQAMADFGTVSQKEVDKLVFTDSVDEAYAYLTRSILHLARERHSQPPVSPQSTQATPNKDSSFSAANLESPSGKN